MDQKGPEAGRQRRFERPVAVVLSSRSKGIRLFEGDAFGVNDNGLGANVRGFPDVPPPAVGDVYRVEFKIPGDLGEIPLARVIRIDPPHGDLGAVEWECFLALRFEAPYDSGRLFTAAMPRRRDEPARTSLDAFRAAVRRRGEDR